MVEPPLLRGHRRTFLHAHIGHGYSVCRVQAQVALLVKQVTALHKNNRDGVNALPVYRYKIFDFNQLRESEC